MNSMRTRIKICGLTREEDIDAAVSAGVDAIGFVFYPKSKRYVTPTRAAQLRRAVPALSLIHISSRRPSVAPRSTSSSTRCPRPR